MLQRIAIARRRIGIWFGASLIALAGFGLARLAVDRYRAQSAPVQMDQLQVNDSMQMTSNAYWVRTQLVLGQTQGGAVTGTEGTFVSYSPNGGCVGGSCSDNAEWHDAENVVVSGVGPQETFWVTDGASHAQGIAATVKVFRHNGVSTDSSGDYDIFVQGQNANGAGLNRGFTLDANLHLNYASESLAPTSCGSGPSFSGGDAMGFGTTGTTASGCTIPWVIPYDTTPPGCLVVVSNGAAAAPTWVESTTSLVVTFATPGTYALRWQCAGGT